MLSTLQVTERVLAYPYDILHNIHEYAYVKFPIALEVPRSTHKYRKQSSGHLPFDIKDIVLKSLDSPRDLVSLALTSKEWANTIIPDYLYRELNVPISHGEIWKALASRPTLAQRTHTLRLLEPARQTMNNSNGPSLPDLSSVVHNLSLALPNCAFLRKFCWTGSRRPLEVSQVLLDALARCPMLQEIDLGPVVLDQDDPHLEESKASLWKLDRLTRLTLRGDWDRSRADVLYLSLIKNAPNLEELSILYGPASIHFASCPLPKLRKLHLWHDSLYIQFPESELYPYDVQIFTFLVNHPLIEDLRWLTSSWTLSSSSPLVTHKPFLPNLKHLRAHGQLYRTLLLQDHHRNQIRLDVNPIARHTHTHQNTIERKWESIARATLSADLPIFEKLDLTMLREIRLGSFEGFDSLARLAGLAKGIVTLAIPGFGPPLGLWYQSPALVSVQSLAQNHAHAHAHVETPTMESLNLERCFTALSLFPLLESLLDTRLWASILRLDSLERARALVSLTSKCPNLYRLSHWDALRHGEVDIVFERDVGVSTGTAVDAVRWYETPSGEDSWGKFGGV